MYYMHDPQHSMCTVQHKTYNVHHAAFRQLLLRRNRRPPAIPWRLSHITYHIAHDAVWSATAAFNAQRSARSVKHTFPNSSQQLRHSTATPLRTCPNRW
jgi:hypothetical protein